jgi:hypothetical protein
VQARDRDEAAQAAEYLLRKKFLLTALELHQELLEANGGVHEVEALNDVFGSPAKLQALNEANEKSFRANPSGA